MGDRPHRLEVLNSVQRTLRRLRPAESMPVLESIASLVGNPRPTGAGRVSGTKYWRIRVGDLRVIYEIDEERRLVVIHKVARRNESTYRRIRETTEAIGE